MKRWAGWVVGASFVCLILAGCGSDGSDDSGGSSADTKITVFAASSLTATFQEIGKKFEAAHDGVSVDFNFAGSSDLVAQIQQGAPADVFASADQANMDKLTGDNLQGSDPQNFASNTLEIAVPPGNPAGVVSFADLAKPGLKLVVCAPEVPCGAATVQVAQSAGVELNPVSEEQSVTDVLGKVTSGEADAGLVYVTDVQGAGDSVEGVEFPESANAVNVYPMATIAENDEPELAHAFVDLVLDATGQGILQAAGFAPAP
jgi:molybdate transport system substrate-binding protein